MEKKVTIEDLTKAVIANCMIEILTINIKITGKEIKINTSDYDEKEDILTIDIYVKSNKPEEKDIHIINNFDKLTMELIYKSLFNVRLLTYQIYKEQKVKSFHS